MTFQREAYEEFQEIEDTALVADGSSVEIKGVGSVILDLAEKSGGLKLKFQVFFVPSLKDNLLPLGTLEEKGFTVRGSERKLSILDGEEILMTAHRHGRIYHVFTEGKSEEPEPNEDTNLTYKSGQERFGHLNPAALKEILPLTSVSKTNEEKKNCDVCIEGKFKKPSPIYEYRRAEEPLQRIHCG